MTVRIRVFVDDDVPCDLGRDQFVGRQLAIGARDRARRDRERPRHVAHGGQAGGRFEQTAVIITASGAAIARTAECGWRGRDG